MLAASRGRPSLHPLKKSEANILYNTAKMGIWASKQTWKWYKAIFLCLTNSSSSSQNNQCLIEISDIHQIIFSHIGAGISTARTFNMQIITKHAAGCVEDWGKWWLVDRSGSLAHAVFAEADWLTWLSKWTLCNPLRSGSHTVWLWWCIVHCLVPLGAIVTHTPSTRTPSTHSSSCLFIMPSPTPLQWGSSAPECIWHLYAPRHGWFSLKRVKSSQTGLVIRLDHQVSCIWYRLVFGWFCQVCMQGWDFLQTGFRWLSASMTPSRWRTL